MLEYDFILADDFSFVSEEFYAQKVTPAQTDALLAGGWRHFGAHFFRYNLEIYRSKLTRVLAFRIRLADYADSKSQRRIRRKNRDLRVVVRPIEITREKENLFNRHKRRFKHAVPRSIYDFLDADAANVPCKGKEICIYDGEKLLAASFFAVGKTAASGTYAMFEPTETGRSLGIYTMLLEIDFARAHGKRFYYSGYAYTGESFYDYKKRFSALETYDWNTGDWEEFKEIKQSAQNQFEQNNHSV